MTIKYQIWVTDKSKIPTLIKEYPYKDQCITWAILNGYIYRGEHGYLKDKRVEFREMEDERFRN